MLVSQVANCSFEKWYPLFKNITFKSEIIPLSDDVLDYLRSNSTIILPKSCQEQLDSDLKKQREQRKKDYDTDSEDDDLWKDEQQDATNYPDFGHFDKQLELILKENFSNRAFIKLNWSSPKDAYWSLNKLCCERLSDIYILLKSSDFISHDLNSAFSDCVDASLMKSTVIDNFKYFLVLKQWVNVNPSMEFRCFVHKHKLVGISQRDCRSFYKTLVDNKQELLEKIEKFYLEKIYRKFLDDSFVFDIYVGKNSVKLVDFNPFGTKTDSLLYSWDELQEDALLQGGENDIHKSANLELRIVDTDIGVQSNPLSMYSAPIESLMIQQNALHGDVLASLVQESIDLQDKEPENND